MNICIYIFIYMRLRVVCTVLAISFCENQNILYIYCVLNKILYTYEYIVRTQQLWFESVVERYLCMRIINILSISTYTQTTHTHTKYNRKRQFLSALYIQTQNTYGIMVLCILWWVRVGGFAWCRKGVGGVVSNVLK